MAHASRPSTDPVRRGILGLAAALLFTLGATLPGSAQALEDYDYENLAFRGVGLSAGAIWPSTLESATSYRLRVDLGYLGPGVRIVPALTYWSSSLEDSEIAAFEQQLGGAVELGEIDLSDMALQVDAHFVWTTPIDLLTYLGVGAGMHALNGQGESIDDTFIEDLLDSFMPGISLIGGVEYPFAPRLRVFGEGRYTIVSDFIYPELSLGLSFMFPTRVQGEG